MHRRPRRRPHQWKRHPRGPGDRNRSSWTDGLPSSGRTSALAIPPRDFDLAYWHVEESLTGLLGAAAWAINGWSLEEFCTGRVAGDSRSAGHGDLWLGREHANATIEAKMCWIDHNVQEPEQCVLSGLAEARAQLYALDGDCQVGQLVSVCYIVPWYQKPKRRENGLKAIALLEGFARKADCATAKHLTAAENIEDEGRKYPGVLLVAREETKPS
jgi:hypothetical protein